MPANRDMPWFKMWGNDYINGTTRSELDPAERSVWVDLLALASISPNKGVVALGDNVPYPQKTLADMLKVPLGVLKSSLTKLVKYDKIRIESGVIFIINWDKYQDTTWDANKYPSQRGSRGVGRDLGVLLVEQVGDKLVASVSVSVFCSNSINRKDLEAIGKHSPEWVYEMCFNSKPSALTQGEIVRFITKHGRPKVNYAMIAAAKKTWRFGMVEEILEKRITGQGGKAKTQNLRHKVDKK